MQAFRSTPAVSELTLSQLDTIETICSVYDCGVDEISRKTDIITVEGIHEGDCIMAIQSYLKGYNSRIQTVSTVI